MSRLPITILLGFLLLLSTSWNHKFYVGIFQLRHVPEKKMLQISCRIFADDLDAALEKKYQKKFHFQDGKESVQSGKQLQDYLSTQLKIRIDGKQQPLDYRSFELENNVIVIYLRITDVPKVNSISVHNTMLFNHLPDQQNIIQLDVGGQKHNFLLTQSRPEDSKAF